MENCISIAYENLYEKGVKNIQKGLNVFRKVLKQDSNIKKRNSCICIIHLLFYLSVLQIHVKSHFIL